MSQTHNSDICIIKNEIFPFLIIEVLFMLYKTTFIHTYTRV